MKSKVSPEEPTGEVMIRGWRGLVKMGFCYSAGWILSRQAMTFWTHSEQPDECFGCYTDQRVACGINWRDPPEMKRETPCSKDNRTGCVCKRQNQRFSHRHEDFFRRSHERIEYPGPCHEEADACPNRNSTFHACTPIVTSWIISSFPGVHEHR